MTPFHRSFRHPLPRILFIAVSIACIVDARQAPASIANVALHGEAHGYGDFGYTYDILIYPDQLEYTVEFVKEFPDQPFVLDHIAKPYIKNKEIAAWKKDIETLAGFDNVFCKISGMVTEADWRNWKPADFDYYTELALSLFGPDRLIFGSDWPVCLLRAEYAEVCGIVEDWARALGPREDALLRGGNAARCYGLPLAGAAHAEPARWT